MRPMHIQLLVPGLLWPDDAPGMPLHSALDSLALPALARLLGRGRRRLDPPCGYPDWLAQRFGIDPSHLPAAALRALADGLDARHGIWLCADPVHLRLARDSLTLADPAELALSAEECAALSPTLAAELAHVGEFFAPHPQRWYLRLATPPRARFHDLDQVVGRNLQAWLPEGDEARAWRRALTESQTLLHGHPVNQLRERRGLPPANSLWFWGAGALPADLAAPADAVLTDEPLARGLALAAGLTPAAPEFAALGGRDALWIAGAAREPHRTLDATRWREALQALEHKVFAPLLAALQDGAVDSLELAGLGDAATLELRVTRGDLRRFWRRPKDLTALTAP